MKWKPKFILSLTIKKKQALIANSIFKNPTTYCQETTTYSTAKRNIERLFESIVYSNVTDNILFYISGSIISNLGKKIDCQNSETLMVKPAASTSHHYLATPCANFVPLYYN